MLLKTQDLQNVCKTILTAVNVDKSAGNLELATQDGKLVLAITNSEYYVKLSFDVDSTENFKAVVDATLFLNLIAGITSEELSLDITDNCVTVKAGKSKYKLPMIFENDSLLVLPKIEIMNKTCEMCIPNDILQTILNINSKELQKLKGADKNTSINELQKMYYIDENGCYTFTSGACLTEFKLAMPIKLLLTDKIVKLFKLFKNDVNFTMGHDTISNNTIQTKVTFEADGIYVAAITTSNDFLLNKVQVPCMTIKHLIYDEIYSNHVVLSTTKLSEAIGRLITFTKRVATGQNAWAIKAKAKITAEELTLTDSLGNSETVIVENGTYIDKPYELSLNLVDLQLVLATCKEANITLNCGNHQAVVISRGTVKNLLPEGDD